MKTTDNTHEPTPEFSEFLARDIARRLRHEARFAPSAASIRARKLSVIMASAVGTVVVLAIGLIFGTSTGYASARVESDRQQIETAATTLGASSQIAELRMDLGRARTVLAQLAANKDSVSQATLRTAESDLRAMEASAGQIQLDLTPRHDTAAKLSPSIIGGISMKTALAVTCSALALGVPAAPVPQAIPTITLPAASAKSTFALWSVAGVRQLSGGKLIVNDNVGREIRVFDSTLATSVVTIDSTSYGLRRPQPIPLLRFTGDSTLLADPQSRTLRVLDARGQVARTIALPDAPFNLSGPGYTDGKGHVLFAARAIWMTPGASADSLPILRLDLASGRVDTVGRIKSSDGRFSTRIANRDTGNYAVRLAPFSFGSQSLVPSRDDWAVLSDGSVAIVRGHDYHIDWIHSDGTASSSAKLPFDWQGLADESKKQMLDTAAYKVAQRQRITIAGDTMASKIYKAQLGLYVNLLSILQPGAGTMIPDLDGNVWIQPSASPAPATADAVYDVVNGKGELFQRVRVPAGKSIAGFGPGGVVYLSSGDRRDGYFLERTRLPGSK